MVLADAIIFLILLALLLRRDLGALGRTSYRGGWRLAAGVLGLFVLQATTVLYVPGQSILQLAVLSLSQMALIILVLLNRHLPGAKLFASGIFLNATVMLANGGWMPISPHTYQFVHPDRTVEIRTRPFNSKGMVLPREETRLWVLSDIIRISLPWRRTAMSFGDLLLILGAARFIFQRTSRSGNPSPGWSGGETAHRLSQSSE